MLEEKLRRWIGSPTRVSPFYAAGISSPRKLRAKALSVAIGVLLFSLALVAPAVHATSPSIVQSDVTHIATTTSCGFNNAQGCFYLTLGSAVSSGDVMVVAFNMQGGNPGTPEKVSDSLGDTYTSAEYQAYIFPSTVQDNQYIYYSGLIHSGSDQLNVTFNGLEGEFNFMVYEVSGVQSTPAGASYGLSTSGTTSTGVSAISFTTEGFIFGQAYGDNNGYTNDNPQPGTGFTIVPPPSGAIYSWGEESVSGVSGTSTTIPMSLAMGDNWLETGIAFNAASAVPDLPAGVWPLLVGIPLLYLVLTGRLGFKVRRDKRTS